MENRQNLLQGGFVHDLGIGERPDKNVCSMFGNGRRRPYSASNQLGVIMVALGSMERYIGMTSCETYRRPASPMTARQAIIQLFAALPYFDNCSRSNRYTICGSSWSSLVTDRATVDRAPAPNMKPMQIIGSALSDVGLTLS